MPFYRNHAYGSPEVLLLPLHSHFNYYYYMIIIIISIVLFLAMLGLHWGTVASLAVVHRLSHFSTCGILVPQPGVEPTSPALEDSSLPLDRQASPNTLQLFLITVGRKVMFTVPSILLMRTVSILLILVNVREF